ncbi:hypothetical protein RRG08_003702 [Elysia crispata]|uniref:Uncharacterized protein n=1 Tax=Elysia crispata TaxID=231223 RepID=A0AAE1E596_9GAST|nr:hypothetical protein RRG08_003702 [Elysia crispata]
MSFSHVNFYWFKHSKMLQPCTKSFRRKFFPGVPFCSLSFVLNQNEPPLRPGLGTDKLRNSANTSHTSRDFFQFLTLRFREKKNLWPCCKTIALRVQRRSSADFSSGDEFKARSFQHYLICQKFVCSAMQP